MEHVDNGQLATQQRLTTREEHFMFSMAMRNMQAFRRADRFLPDRSGVRPDLQLIAAAFDAVREFFRNHGEEFPPIDYVKAYVEKHVIDVHGDDISDEELEEFDEFLELTYLKDERQLESPAVQSLFKKLLKSFKSDMLYDEIREEVLGSGQNTPRLVEYLEQRYQAARQIEAVYADATTELFAEGWDANPSILELRSTGLAFLDEMLNGGEAAGEVYGLVAPFGSCKTTLAIQMACERATMSYETWQQQMRERRRRLRRAQRQGRTLKLPRPKLGVVYMFIFEDSVEQMRVRALSYKAQIPQDRLRDLRELSDDPENRIDYERVEFESEFAEGLEVPTELERIRATTRQLNDTFAVICMTGQGEEGRDLGGGGPREIRDIIEEDLKRRRDKLKCPVFVETIIVDFVAAAVERQAMLEGWREEQIRRATTAYPLHCVNELGVPFKTSVWCLHQLNGTANGLAPGLIPKGTDTKDSKTFKQHLHGLITVGSKDNQNLCVFNMDKARRGDTNITPHIIRIEGAMSRIRAVSHEWALDRASGQIVDRSELESVRADHPGGVDRGHAAEYANELRPQGGMNLRRNVMRGRNRPTPGGPR